MLKTQQVEEVRRLLAEGRNLKAVGRATGVSRNMIRGIARGLRPDYEAMRRKKQKEATGSHGVVKRCRGCGYRVRMPCRICRARKAAALSAKSGLPFDLLDEPLGLNLRPEHQARYEEVRARRREAERAGRPAPNSPAEVNL